MNRINTGKPNYVTAAVAAWLVSDNADYMHRRNVVRGRKHDPCIRALPEQDTGRRRGDCQKLGQGLAEGASQCGLPLQLTFIKGAGVFC